MKYYKNFSSDVWRKNGIKGFWGSYILSVSAGVLLFMPQIKGDESSIMLFVNMFLAFVLVLFQMFIQRVATNYIVNAIKAEDGENNVSKAVYDKYTTMTLWAWASDYAIFAILYGCAFLGNKLVIACGLPVILGIFLIMAIVAIIWTVKTKKAETNDKEDKTNEEEQ